MKFRHLCLILPLTFGLACASGGKKETASTSKPATADNGDAKAEATPADTAAPAAPAGPPPRKDDAKRKSKNGRLEGTMAGANVIVQYGRPTVRGRTIFGELVAYGKLWRTGADEATTITFDKGVNVEGKALAAGTYALFTIPGESKWTIVFNTVAAQWGGYSYDESKDALRVEVTAKAGDMTEELTFKADGDTLVLAWDKTMVPITFSAQ